ncbi:TNF receptor-associated factor homolog 1b-like protein [Drosera capensis]
MGPRLSERNAIGKPEGMPTGKGCNSGEELDEWRSSEQLESGVASTSSSCYGSDDSDEDGGSKPSELYGKYTWKIQKFSKINKRDIRSNAFDIGGHKWCISIYPQGCEVSNHLSLFLCVSNHEKLLPGWSQLAQFTIAVVNNDPTKSKYSDTLHRFRHKEHDWGWKKFLELSKLSQGFVDEEDGTVTIKAQIQVIREKADRPFRCLACQYKKEVLRIYLTNIEQICLKFVKESRAKLGKLLEDKARWSSFCTFWLGVDQSSKRRLSKENMDMILREIVKQFTIGNEVVAILAMESLYSGLRELEGRGKTKSMKGKLLDGEDTPPPIIRVEKDMFVLADDALVLLEQAASELLPLKDEKGPQNHLKDGSAEEEFSKESSEHNERLLTYFGRRMIEMFVLARIFSNKIEIAYQYDVALKMQEELIREEEKAGAAKSEQKAMHAVSAKEKKSRKKLGKQQRNGRKGKDKAEGKKGIEMVRDKQPCKNAMNEETRLDKGEILEDASDISSSVDDTADMYDADSDDRDGSFVTLDSETSDIHLLVEAGCKDAAGSFSTKANGLGKGRTSVMGDSSSTTSTDSVHSVPTNGSSWGKSFRNAKGQNSPIRVEKLYSKVPSKEGSVTREVVSQLPETVGQRHHNDVFPDVKMTDSEKPVCGCLPSVSTDGIPSACEHKEAKIAFPQKKCSNGVQVNTKGVSIEKAPVRLRSTASSSRLKSETRDNPAIDLCLSTRAPSSNSQQTEKATSSSPQLTEKRASSSQQQTAMTTPSRLQQVEKEDRYSTQRTEKGASASTHRTQEAVSSSTYQTEKAPLLTNMPQSSSWSRPDSMKANGHKPPEKNFGQLPSASNQRTEKAMLSSTQKSEKVPLSTNMPQSSSRPGPDSVKANGLKPPEKHFGQLPSASTLQTEKAMPSSSQKTEVPFSTNLPQLLSRSGSGPDNAKANSLKPPEKHFGQLPSACTLQTQKAMPSISQKNEKVPLSTMMSQSSSWSGPDSVKANALKPPDNVFGQLPSAMSSALSAPLVPGSKPVMTPAISVVQTESATPHYSRFLSEAGWVGPDPACSYAYLPQSHRSPITCTSTAATSSGFLDPYPVSSTVNSSSHFSQQTTVVSAPMFLPRSDGVDSGSFRPGSFGLDTRDIAHAGPYQMSSSQQHISQSMTLDSPSNLNGLNNFDLQNLSNGWAHVPVVSSDVSVSISGQHTQGLSTEEFPHLHIITDLLDDEQQGYVTTDESRVFRGMSSLPNLFNQRLNVSGDLGMSEDMTSLDSSSPFARSSGYYDGFRLDYSSCLPFDSFQEFIPQANLMPYSNGYINDWNPMQVPVGGSDFSSTHMWSSVSDGYSNYVNGYTNPSMYG